MKPSILLAFIGMLASAMMVVFATVHGDYLWSAIYAALAIASWIVLSKSMHQAEPEAVAEPEEAPEEE